MRTRNASRICRVVALLLAAVLLLLAGSAGAGEEDQPAVFTLFLNEVKKGELIVVLRGKDVWAPEADLLAAGLHDLHGKREKLLDKPYVSLASLAPVRFESDENALTLRVTAPPELLPTAVIGMRQSAPSDIVYSTDTSAFLNYTATLADFIHPSGFVEAGFSASGLLLTTSASASLATGVTRGLSQFIIDDRRTQRRFILGDSFAASGELGAGMFVGGLSIAKNFELDPYLVHQPSLGYSGTALTPSTLEIFVDGVRLRQEEIAPGSFRVQDLPVATGSGSVRYVLRDAFGHEHAVDSTYSMVSSQLAPGESSYTYAIGFRRQRVGQASFDYGEPAMLGHHRLGITDKLTMAGRFEAARDVVSGGVTLEALVPFGYLSLSGAASETPAGPGFAGVARYGYSDHRLTASAAVQVLSDHYATLGLDPAGARNTVEARLTTSLPLSPRFSIASEYAFQLPRDTPARFRLGVSLRAQITKQMQLISTASRAMQSDGRSALDASAVLSYAFDHGITASAGARYGAGRPMGFADVSRPVSGSRGLGLRASGVVSEQPRADAVAQYQGPYGTYQASASISGGGPHLTLEASGGLVALAGAGVFPTTPIQNGFAVIRVPGVKDVHGFLDNREVGATNGSGNLVVPNLIPYYGSRIRISDKDLPMDYAIETTEMLFAPPLRGGALATFEAKRVLFYRGQVQLDVGGKKTTPVYGEITLSAGKATGSSPIGKSGEFEIASLSPGSYQATITHEGKACAMKIEAPDREGPVVELGSLVCSLKN